MLANPQILKKKKKKKKKTKTQYALPIDQNHQMGKTEIRNPNLKEKKPHQRPSTSTRRCLRLRLHLKLEQQSTSGLKLEQQ